MDERRRPIGADCAVEHVADLLEEVYAANGLLVDQMDPILGSWATVSRSTIDRSIGLADQLRCGVRVRAQLCGLDPSRVLAGTKVWMALNRERSTNPASDRGIFRWSGKASA